MRILYLHGVEEGEKSKKPLMLRNLGYLVDVPDLRLSESFNLQKSPALQCAALLCLLSFIIWLTLVWHLRFLLKVFTLFPYVGTVWVASRYVSRWQIREMLSISMSIASACYRKHRHDVIIANSLGGAVLLFAKAAGELVGAANIILSPGSGIVQKLLNGCDLFDAAYLPLEGILMIHCLNDPVVPIYHSLYLLSTFHKATFLIDGKSHVDIVRYKDSFSSSGKKTTEAQLAKRMFNSMMRQPTPLNRRRSSRHNKIDPEFLDFETTPAASYPPKPSIAFRLEIPEIDDHSLRATYEPNSILRWLQTVRVLHANSMRIVTERRKRDNYPACNDDKDNKNKSSIGENGSTATTITIGGKPDSTRKRNPNEENSSTTTTDVVADDCD